MSRSILKSLLLFVFSLTPFLWGQSPLATIVGSVHDPSNASIQEAPVTVTNEGTGFQRSTKTDSGGGYAVTDLEPGSYTITIEVPGFKKSIHSHVQLSTAQKFHLDVTLEVGQIQQSVIVTGSTSPVNSETATISESTPQAEIADPYIPLVMYQAPTYLIGQFGLGSVYAGSGNYEVNGSTTNENRYTLDGISSDSYWGFPPMQSYQDVTMVSVNAGAEYATPTTIEATTKGGTNAFHGDSEFDISNTALNALGPLPTTRPPGTGSYDAQFAFSGPVSIPRVYNGKDRTFFSFIFERSKNKDTNFVSHANVPTVAMRGGDFLQLTNASGNLMPIIDPLTGIQFPSNMIPTSRINSTSLKIMNSLYPVPNTGSPDSIVNNYTKLGQLLYAYNVLFARFDQKISGSNTANFSFTRRTQTAKFDVSGSGFSKVPGLYYAVQSQVDDIYSLADVHTFSPHVINEARISYNRFWQPSGENVNGQTVLQQWGIQGIDPSYNYNTLPQLTVTGFAGMGPVYTDNVFLENRFAYLDNVGYQLGRHTFKVGAELIRFQDNTTGANGPVDGTYDFNGQFTTYSFSDFLLGYPDATGRYNPGPPVLARQSSFGAYITDDFKFSPRFTLNLGLRYDLETAPLSATSLYYNFNPKTGAIVVPNQTALQNVSPLFNPAIPIELANAAGFPSKLLMTQKDEFRPRIGVAFRPFNTPKLVLRAGYGVYTVGKVGQANRNAATQFLTTGGPFALTQAFVNTQTSGSAPLLSFPNPFQTTGAGPSSSQYSIGAINPNLRDGYMQQWNLSIEQELFRRTAFRLTYIGNKSTDLSFTRNLSLPPPSTIPFSSSRYVYPNFSSISYIDYGANAHYAAMQVEFTHPTANGLYLHGGMTWARLMDTEATLTNPYDRNYDYGRDDLLPSQRFEIDTVYQLPFGRGKTFLSQAPRLVDEAIGGWIVSGQWALQSGSPYTVTYSGTDPSGEGKTSGRPDVIGNPRLAHPTRFKAFNTAAFAIPPSDIGRFGNSGRNTLTGPIAWGLQTSVHKYFTIAESVKLRVSAFAVDPFNQHSWGNPNSVLTAGGVGQETGMSSIPNASWARTFQLAARLEF